jgi:acyl-CoA thioesterase YciA
MTFLQPVRIGDELTVYADLVKIGRTSITIEVEAWRRPRSAEERSQVTHARFVFVAIDADGKPRPVPPAPDESGPTDSP